MTSGEIAMCQTVFKNAIDYQQVRIYQGQFIKGSGHNALTPFGHPHFPVIQSACGQALGYLDDFSHCRDHVTAEWFIHEMGHVWQYQLGYPVFRQGLWMALSCGYFVRPGHAEPHAYRLPLEHPLPTQRFSQWNMEQQCELIAHYFGSVHWMQPSHLSSHLPFYQAALAEFLHNPANPALLPSNYRPFHP